MSEVGRMFGVEPPAAWPEPPRESRVQPLVDVLHEQGIGCNYVNAPFRRAHYEPGGDPEGLTVRLVYDDPEPTGYDFDGMRHAGDHEAVARAILGLPAAVPS